MKINGVTFGGKHSYNDYGLTMAKRPIVGTPKPKTNYIDIPGSDGALDATTALTGDVTYENRPITFVFNILEDRSKWESTFSDLLDELHGQQMKIILDEDPNYYYFGRITINDLEPDKKHTTFPVEALVEPYKYEMFSSLEDWLWDPFDFESGIIREYKDLAVNGIKVLVIEGRRKPIIPTITVSNVMTVTYNDKRYLLTSGENRILDLVLKQGENELIFRGNGTVSVDYRGGKL